jgi:CBS domain-containing protein
MQVCDAMTAQALCCTPETTLGAAATLMAAGRCGTLPVVHEGKTVGMITDRDICLALAAAQCSPSELPVADVMSEALYVCREEDEIEEALETMMSHQVRRLPVLDRQGALVGLLSIDDILAKAGTPATAFSPTATPLSLSSRFAGVASRSRALSASRRFRSLGTRRRRQLAARPKGLDRAPGPSPRSRSRSARLLPSGRLPARRT